MKLFRELTKEERIESDNLIMKLQKPIEIGTLFASIKPRSIMLNRLSNINPLSYFRLVFIPIIQFVIILFTIHLIITIF